MPVKLIHLFFSSEARSSAARTAAEASCGSDESVLAVSATCKRAMKGLARLAAQGLSFDSVVARDPAAMLARLYDASFDALVIAAPFVIAVVVAAVIAPLLVGGWSISPAALIPNFERIDPFKGLSRLASLRGVTDLVKAILKALVIGTGAIVVLWKGKEGMLALAGQPLDAALGSLGDLVMQQCSPAAAT